MSPDDLEVRLVRIETRAERWDLTVPLIGQTAVMEERVDGLRDDLNDGLKAIRAELAEVKRDTESRSRERRQMLLALLIAGVGLVGTFGAQLVQLRGGK